MRNQHVALLVEGEQHDEGELVDTVTSLGHEYELARSQTEVVERLEARDFCYVLLGLDLPIEVDGSPMGRVGFNTLARIRERYEPEDLPVIATARRRGHVYPVRAWQLGATDFARRPFRADFETVDDKIRRAVRSTCAAKHSKCPNSGMFKTLSADAAGGDDSLTNRLHFDGRCERRRVRVDVNGAPVWLQLRVFESLWILAVALKQNPTPVVQAGEFRYYPPKIWYLLRFALKAQVGVGAPDLVESDGYGGHRLRLDPELVTHDAEHMEANHPRLLQALWQD